MLLYAAVGLQDGSIFDFISFNVFFSIDVLRTLKIDSMRSIYNCQGAGSDRNHLSTVALCDFAKLSRLAFAVCRYTSA